MSNEVNTELIERAKEVAETYTGTLLEDAILANLKRNDLEMVQHLVDEADRQEGEQEWEAHKLPSEVMLKELKERGIDVH